MGHRIHTTGKKGSTCRSTHADHLQGQAAAGKVLNALPTVAHSAATAAAGQDRILRVACCRLCRSATAVLMRMHVHAPVCAWILDRLGSQIHVPKDVLVCRAW